MLDVVLFAGLTAAATPAVFANVSSYSCGILLSYALNRSWTFAVGGSFFQGLKFCLFALIGLLFSTLLVALLTTIIPAIHAKLISVPVVFAWNYLSARLWVFKASEARSSGLWFS